MNKEARQEKEDIKNNNLQVFINLLKDGASGIRGSICDFLGFMKTCNNINRCTECPVHPSNLNNIIEQLQDLVDNRNN